MILDSTFVRLYVVSVNMCLTTFFLFSKMRLYIMTTDCYGWHDSVQNTEVNKV